MWLSFFRETCYVCHIYLQLVVIVFFQCNLWLSFFWQLAGCWLVVDVFEHQILKYFNLRAKNILKNAWHTNLQNSRNYLFMKGGTGKVRSTADIGQEWHKRFVPCGLKHVQVLGIRAVGDEFQLFVLLVEISTVKGLALSSLLAPWRNYQFLGNSHHSITIKQTEASCIAPVW